MRGIGVKVNIKYNKRAFPLSLMLQNTISSLQKSNTHIKFPIMAQKLSPSHYKSTTSLSNASTVVAYCRLWPLLCVSYCCKHNLKVLLVSSASRQEEIKKNIMPDPSSRLKKASCIAKPFLFSNLFSSALDIHLFFSAQNQFYKSKTNTICKPLF